jgi:hypothetical protein
VERIAVGFCSAYLSSERIRRLLVGRIVFGSDSEFSVILSERSESKDPQQFSTPTVGFRRIAMVFSSGLLAHST